MKGKRNLILFLCILCILSSCGHEIYFTSNVASYQINAIENIDLKLDEFTFPEMELFQTQNNSFYLDITTKYGIVHSIEGESSHLSIAGSFSQLKELFKSSSYRLISSSVPNTYINNDSIIASIRKNRNDDQHEIFASVNISIQLTPIKVALPNLVTFIIKTHERPQCLELLLDSIRIFYKDVQIIVADDGRNPNFLWKNGINDKNYKYLPLEYDIGLSASRNILVDMVSTKYFLLLDDDFVFTEKTKVEKLLIILENTQFSMAGGSLYTDENPYYDYSGLIETDDQRNFRLREGSIGEVKDSFDSVGKLFDCKQVEIIANFFMAKTKDVQKVRWDDNLKLGEHQDFFLRYKQEGLKVASCGKEITVYHKQNHSDPDYKRKRQREYMFLRKFLEKHNLNSFILFSGLTYIKV